MKYKNILPSFQVKSRSKFLSVSSNRTVVVKFIVSDWKKPEFTSKLESKLLFVTLGEECWKLGSTGIEAVPELQSNHDEADTQRILHAKHVQGPCIIHANDTDVLVLIPSHCNTLDAAYVKVPMKRNFYVFLRKSIKKLEDCFLPFLNILLGSRVTKL